MTMTETPRTTSAGGYRPGKQAHHDAGNTSTGSDDFLTDAKRALESGAATLSRSVQRNPTLALAGLVAVGALAAVAVRQYRAPRRTQLRALQDDALRTTRAVRRAIHNEIQNSGLPSRIDQLVNNVSAIDWKPYIQPLVERAVSASETAKDRIASIAK